MAEPVLKVRDLRVVFRRRREADIVAVDGVSFDVEPGQVVGLLGESGSGKLVTARAVMRSLPVRGVQITGSVTLDGADLLVVSARKRRDAAGGVARGVAMVFRESELSPGIRIGVQLGGRRAEAADLLHRVGIPDPARYLDAYPRQVGPGLRQRALVAIALAGRPRLLIVDEPASAREVTVRAQVLDLLRRLARESGIGLMVVTDDVGVAARMCETVNVLYAGRIVERAQRHRLFATPRHPYTHGLLRAVPRVDTRGELTAIRGSVADNLPWSEACAFAPRCPRVTDACTAAAPPVEISGGRLLRCHNPVPASPE